MSSRFRCLVEVVAVVLMASLMVVVRAGPVAAAVVSVPAGFDDITVTDVPAPTAMAGLPDGRMVVTSQDGRLWVLNADGTRPAAPAVTLPVCHDSERGLLGVDVDPQVATNGFVFVYYTFDTGAGCQNRVSRLTLTGSTVSLSSEQVLIDGIPATEGNHNGGDVHVGNDGLLYVSVGDNGCNPRTPHVNCAIGNPAARNLAVPNGKILRINRDGSIPAGNPFQGGGTARCDRGPVTDGVVCQEIVAYGLRNPFRFAPDPNTTGPDTRFFVNDVGQDTAEEIDEFGVGRDYGWNQREGFCAAGTRTDCHNPPAGMTDPIFDYTHTEVGCDATTGSVAITGGAFVPDGAWPVHYDHGYVYADYGCQQMWVLLPTGNGAWTSEPFASGVGPVTSMRPVQRLGTWSIYYATYANGGQLHRIVSTRPPGSTNPAAFHPLTPTRILDTRDGVTGYTGRKPSAGTTFSVHVTGTVSAVPVDAVAVALNLTGTAAAAAGYITVWPTGQTRPLSSALNFSGVNDTVANAVIVPVGTGGDINLFTQNGAHLVADVTGYWTETVTAHAGRYVPTPNPARLVDTRVGTGVTAAGLIGAGASIDVQVNGHGGIPLSGVAAVALVVTVANTAGSGYVTAWPTGTPRPLASSVNPVGANDLRSNLVLVPVGTNGQVSLYTLLATHLVVDVAGWFTDATAPEATSGLMVTVAPNRPIDTRTNRPFGRLTGGETGVSDYSPVVTAGAIAIAANVTVDNTADAGFLTAWPNNNTRPTASNLNWNGTNQTRAALTISNLDTNNKIGYQANTATDLIVDIAAYFTD